MTDESIRDQVRHARSKFFAMAGCYGLGVFNDSFFRQSAMLLAVSAGMNATQNWIMALFMLPYVLFSWASGWLADRFAKRYVVIGAKLLEVVAMTFGAIGIITLDWSFIMTMVFLMAWQSCIFSPALNGSIPELYPDAYVIRANARLKVVTTAAILGGISIAGVILDVMGTAPGGVPMGRMLVGVSVLVIAVLGVVVSFGVPKRPAADPQARFPRDGLLETFRNVRVIWRDRLLRLVVMADVFVWFVGTLLTQVINVLAIQQFGRSKTLASAMLAVWVVGVAAGGIVGSRIAVGRRWYRGIPMGLVGMGALFVLMACVPLLPREAELPVVFVLLGLIALLGGMVLIPCEGFVQTRPAADRKGAVIAAVNFCAFSGMLVSCGLAWVLDQWLLPTTSFAAAGVLALPMGLWMKRALAKEETR
ncbi:MAG TPA: MFS transporter [Planctomycetota bacterium]|nr:MFS transporter [Planctomycetota bacterium]